MADSVGRGIDREVGESERRCRLRPGRGFGQAAEEADVDRVLAGLAVDVERAVGKVASTNACRRRCRCKGRRGRYEEGVSEGAVDGEGVAAVPP